MGEKHLKVFILLGIILFIITGFAFLGVSYLPFELLKVKLDSYTFSGSADKFTVELFEKIASWLRLIAIVIFLASGLLYMGRRQVHQYIFPIP